MLRVGFDGRDLLRKRTGVVNYAVNLAAQQAQHARQAPRVQQAGQQAQPAGRQAERAELRVRQAEHARQAQPSPLGEQQPQWPEHQAQDARRVPREAQETRRASQDAAPQEAQWAAQEAQRAEQQAQWAEHEARQEHQEAQRAERQAQWAEHNARQGHREAQRAEQQAQWAEHSERQSHRPGAPTAEFVVYADRFVDPQVAPPPGVNLRRLAAPPIAWKHLALPLALWRDRIAVFHSPTGTLPLLAPCRQIVTIHDLFAAVEPGWFSPSMARQLTLSQRRSARSADAVIAVSACTRRDLVERYGIPEAKVTVIHNGVDHARLKPMQVDAEQIAHRYGVPYPFILCVGSLMPWRNGPRLLRAVARLRGESGSPRGMADARSADNPRNTGTVRNAGGEANAGKLGNPGGAGIAGNVANPGNGGKAGNAGNSASAGDAGNAGTTGWSGKAGKLGLLFVGRDIWGTDPTARIAAAHGWDWARFAGYVAGDELPALYAAARVFAYPSLYEGFGIPPLEAMACGTPVVASTAGALPEVLGDAALLVDPYDEDALAQAIEAAAAEPLASELRRKGLQHAARFDWATTAEQTWALYERTATRP